jgi:mannan endo-1,4-beta-mannosidase
MAIPIVAMLAVGTTIFLLPHHKPPVRYVGPRTVAQASACGEERKVSRYVGIAPGVDWQLKIKRFTSAGLRPSLVIDYTSFGIPLDGTRMCQLIKLGDLPLVVFNPRTEGLRAIAAGKYDAWIKSYAHEVSDLHHRIVLSFAPEMNGWWDPWGAPKSTPTAYVAAWRHIHNIFKREHVTNVIWSWDIDDCCSSREWWPGAQYVNWVGVDGYLRQSRPFSVVFAGRINEVRSFTKKPIFIAETAVAPGPEWKTNVTSLFTGERRDHLFGVVWFDSNAQARWRIDNNRAELAFVQREATK